MYFVNLFGGDQSNIMVRFNAATANMDQTLNSTIRALGGEATMNFDLLIANPGGGILNWTPS